MAEVADSGPVEPQARHIVYCGGKWAILASLPPRGLDDGGGLSRARSYGSAELCWEAKKLTGLIPIVCTLPPEVRLRDLCCFLS
jgi:hypothetical protein